MSQTETSMCSEKDHKRCIFVALAVAVFVTFVVAVVASIVLVSLNYESIKKIKDDANKLNKVEESLKTLQDRVANFTSKSKSKSEITARTIALLGNETKKLKHYYAELLRETSTLNKTINYTTSSTVQRALEELRNIKKTQKDIQEKLEALSHLNDTAEDYLNLRKELDKVKILSTEVNQNITRVEKTVKDNRREWKVLNQETSEIKSNISNLEQQFKGFDPSVNEAVTVLDKTSDYVMLYGIMLFAIQRVA